MDCTVCIFKVNQWVNQKHWFLQTQDQSPHWKKSYHLEKWWSSKDIFIGLQPRRLLNIITALVVTGWPACNTECFGLIEPNHQKKKKKKSKVQSPFPYIFVDSTLFLFAIMILHLEASRSVWGLTVTKRISNFKEDI